MKHNRWMKMMALAVIAVMAVTMLASCKSGATYADESGDESVVTVIQKDQQVEVPYEGEPIQNIIYTDDPAYADKSSGGDSSSDDEDNSANEGEEDTNEPSGESGDEGEKGEEDSSGGDDDSNKWAGDKSGTPITFLTQNIRTGSSLTGVGDGEENTIGIRRYRFKALVEKYDPDVICTQEVTPLWITQFESLLTDYDMVYKMRSDASKEATPVHWKKDKYTLEDSGHFWLSPTPNVESSCYGEPNIPARITSWAKLKDKATNVSFYVYSTHFGLGGGKVVIGAGNQLANELSLKPSGTYAFFMGDFNDAYQSTEYYTYVDMSRAIDLRDVASDMARYDICEMGDMRKGTFNGFKAEDGSGGFIDHIIAKPNAKLAVDFYGVLYDQMGDEANNASVGFVADHFGVLCKVRINTSVSYADFYGDL